MSNWGHEEQALEKLVTVAGQHRMRYANSYREVTQSTRDMHQQAHELLGTSTSPKSETYRTFETLERAIESAHNSDRHDPDWSVKATHVLEGAILAANEYLKSRRQ